MQFSRTNLRCRTNSKFSTLSEMFEIILNFLSVKFCSRFIQVFLLFKLSWFLKISKNMKTTQKISDASKNLHAKHESKRAWNKTLPLFLSLSLIFLYNDKSINNVRKLTWRKLFFFCFPLSLGLWKYGTHNFSPSTWQHNNFVTENFLSLLKSFSVWHFLLLILSFVTFFSFIVSSEISSCCLCCVAFKYRKCWIRMRENSGS